MLAVALTRDVQQTMTLSAARWFVQETQYTWMCARAGDDVGSEPYINEYCCIELEYCLLNTGVTPLTSGSDL